MCVIVGMSLRGGLRQLAWIIVGLVLACFLLSLTFVG